MFAASRSSPARLRLLSGERIRIFARSPGHSVCAAFSKAACGDRGAAFASPRSSLMPKALPGIMPAHDAMPRVREAARKALSIDPSLPEAHALLGAVAAIYDYDWVEADRLFRLATRGDSVPPIVRFTSMLYLLPVGRLQEAVAEYARALDEDP